MPPQDNPSPDAETRKHSLLGVLQAWLPVLTVVIGAAWAVYTYVDHQKDVQQQAVQQAAREASTRKLEAQKPFLEKQLALYYEAAQVTGVLTTAKPGDAVWQDRTKRFWQLYWSELSMVETPEIEAAMARLGNTLREYEKAPDKDGAKGAFEQDTLALAHAIRKSIEATWQPAGAN